MTAIFVILLPGLLLFLSKEMEKKGISEVIVYAISASLSFFMVSAWAIRYTGFSLQGFTFIVLILSLIMLLIRSRDVISFFGQLDRDEAAILLVFFAVILFRLIPAIFQIAPAGADMSMHSYIARLIFENDRIPSSYEPLFPVSGFSAFATGFPTITAIFSLVSNMPIYRSALYLSLFTHALIPFGIFILLLRFYDKKTSLGGALASGFLLRDPQWMIRLGGNPGVLALFFFLISASLILMMHREGSYLKAFLLALSTVSMLLCHTIIFYAGMYMLAAIWLYNGRDIKAKWKLWAAAFCMALLMTIPCLAGSRISLIASAVPFAKACQAVNLRSVIYDLIAGIPLIIICIGGIILLNKKEKKLLRLCFIFLGGIAVLLLGHKFRFLPFSYLLSPGHITLLLILPVSILSAPVLKNFTERSRAITIFLVVLGLSYYIAFYAVNSVLNSPITPADMKALIWMDTTLGKRAVIMNNYGDAGLWIPAMIGRTITNPCSEPVYAEELHERLKKLKAAYIYIGSKQSYDDVDIDKEYLEKRPWRYKRLYSQDGAQVWKVLY